MKKLVLIVLFVFLAVFFTSCCPLPPLPPPTINIDKMVLSDCNWQKSITAERGDWVSVRVLVVVTGTIGDVSVKDELKNPFSEVRNLEVNSVPHCGNIISGISLGTLKNESREITFEVKLSPLGSDYVCGENVLVNKAEAWSDCGYKAISTVEITVYRYCPPPPCPSPCPPPIPPPPPPDCDEGGPGPDPL